MTLEQYAYLAEIIGVIIVVVTLLYLAVQVRQGAILMRSEARKALLNNDRDVLLAYLDHQDVFDKIENDDELSAADQRRFSSLWIINLRNREHEWFQYQDGILDEKTWLTQRNVIRLVLGSRRHRMWWDKIKFAYDSDFVEMVDQYIGEVPESQIWEQTMGAWDQAA